MPYIWLVGLVYFGMHDALWSALLWCAAFPVGMVLLPVVKDFVVYSYKMINFWMGDAEEHPEELDFLAYTMIMNQTSQQR